MLYCANQIGVSVHIYFGGSETSVLTGTKPLNTELRFLREFMKNCLQQWYQYVNERRSECYHLNYFTTEQLVLLRSCLAEFASSDQVECLPPQVLVLLSAVNSHCTADDVRRALKDASKDIMKPTTDEAGIADQQQAAKEAERREKAVAIVKEQVDNGLEEKAAWAAIQALGLEESDDKYMEWCVDNVQNEDEVDKLFSDLRLLQPYLLRGDEEVVSEEQDDMDFKSLPSMAQEFQEVTQSLVNKAVNKR